MKSPSHFSRIQSLFVTSCLISVVVSFWSFSTFDGTEFGAGSLSANKNIGTIGLILALAVAIKFRKLAVIFSYSGSIFSLPFYTYLLFPRPYQQMFIGNWAIDREEVFVWNHMWFVGWASLLGIIIIGALILKSEIQKK